MNSMRGGVILYPQHPAQTLAWRRSLMNSQERRGRGGTEGGRGKTKGRWREGRGNKGRRKRRRK